MKHRAILTRLETLIHRYKIPRERFYMDARTHAVLDNVAESVQHVTVFLDELYDFKHLANNRTDVIDDTWTMMFQLEEDLWIAYSKDSDKRIDWDRQYNFQYEYYTRVRSLNERLAAR